MLMLNEILNHLTKHVISLLVEKMLRKSVPIICCRFFTILHIVCTNDDHILSFFYRLSLPGHKKNSPRATQSSTSITPTIIHDYQRSNQLPL